MAEKKRKQKKLIVILVLVAMLTAVIIVFGIPYIKRHFFEVKVNEAEAVSMDKVDLGTDRILTVYFTRNGNCDFDDDVDAVTSASLMRDGDKLIGNCELAAEMVHNAVGGDIYAIRTKKKYPSSYGGTVKEAGAEFKSKEKIELEGELPDISKYDKVFILYPLWWYKVPMAVQSFLEEVDLRGKEVYAVVSHGGSGDAGSISQLSDKIGEPIKEPFYVLYDDDTLKSKKDLTEWLMDLAPKQ